MISLASKRKLLKVTQFLIQLWLRVYCSDGKKRSQKNWLLRKRKLLISLVFYNQILRVAKSVVTDSGRASGHLFTGYDSIYPCPNNFKLSITFYMGLKLAVLDPFFQTCVTEYPFHQSNKQLLSVFASFWNIFITSSMKKLFLFKGSHKHNDC